MTIVPPVALPDGEAFTVAVSYSGTPRPAASTAIPFSLGWQTGPAGTRFVVAEPDAAHTWFPSNDHPLDKATYTFRITVPDPLTAAANGVLVDQIRDLGQSTWVWEMTDPMATYLATVVIGAHVIIEDEATSEAVGIPIRHVLPPDLAADPPPTLDRLADMFDLLVELFGPYPFEVYGIAAVDGFGAALENQTLSLFGLPFPPDTFADVVMVHELAHQWFGNSVSPARWEDIWLNEGFASYAEWLWLERELGRAEVDLGIEAERQTLAESGLPAAGDPGAASLFGPSVYRVGAMALHALRLEVGDDTFFDILRTYHERYAGSSATTDDFVDVAEEVSGTQLDELFAVWLYSTDLPEFP